MRRFLVVFVALLAFAFAFELTPFAQAHLVTPWSHTVAGQLAALRERADDRTRADALKIRGMEAVRLMLGVALLLVVAGIIEGFVSPAPINPRIKYSVAAMTGIALYSYLLFMGRQQEPKPLQ